MVDPTESKSAALDASSRRSVPVEPRSEPAKLANAAIDTVAPRSSKPSTISEARPAPEVDLITQAKKIMADCQARYARIQDYTCTFYKRERLVDGHLTTQNTMHMKHRTRPNSIYFKFVKPTPGREAIFVEGRNGGKAYVHDVGIGKLLAGTLSLDPRGSTAMEGCRHPITDAGIAA